MRWPWRGSLLIKPPWVLIDEVLDSLDDAWLERTIDIFAKDLAQSAIIYIGRSDAHHVFTRVLHLIMDPTAKKLKTLAARARRGRRARGARRRRTKLMKKRNHRPARTGGTAR